MVGRSPVKATPEQVKPLEAAAAGADKAKTDRAGSTVLSLNPNKRHLGGDDKISVGNIFGKINRSLFVNFLVLANVSHSSISALGEDVGAKTTITAAIKFNQRNLNSGSEGETLEYYKFVLSIPNSVFIIRRSEAGGAGRNQNSGSGSHALGEVYAWTTYDGQPLSASWRVRGPHEIEYFQDYPTFSRTAHFKVRGSGCVANMSFELKKGETIYRFPTIRSGGKIWNEYDHVYFTEAVCHIE